MLSLPQIYSEPTPQLQWIHSATSFDQPVTDMLENTETGRVIQAPVQCGTLISAAPHKRPQPV